MSKQDPNNSQGLPPAQFAYGAPLQQQYGSMPPPYSAVPPATAASYGGYAPQAGGMYAAHASNPYGQHQFVPMPQVQPMQSAGGSSHYPRQQFMPAVQQQGLQGPPPPYTQVAQPMMVTQPTVVVGGAFDAGARFDGISQQRIPPPPPGMSPNAAQMAALQGHQVVGTQQRSNWFTGGTGGGSTFF